MADKKIATRAEKEALMQAQQKRERMLAEGYVETSPGVFSGSPVERAARRSMQAVGNIGRNAVEGAKKVGRVGLAAAAYHPVALAGRVAYNTLAPQFRTETVNTNPILDSMTDFGKENQPPQRGSALVDYLGNYATGNAGGLSGLAAPKTILTPEQEAARVAQAQAEKAREQATGIITNPTFSAEEGRQQVSDLYSNLKAQGRTVGEMQSGGIMSGDGGTSGTYRAFASWSPEQMAARKAQEDNTPDTALADELTGTIVGKVVPQTGVETRSATAQQVSVPKADASPDYDKNFREATMRAAQDGVRSAPMRDQTLVQRLGLSPYQQAQRRIGVQVTQGNGPRGYVKAPVGLGASQSVGISNNAMPRTKPTGFASENEWQG